MAKTKGVVGMRRWGKILRVDLTAGEARAEEVPEAVYRDYIGGGGIAARMLYDESGADTYPLGEDNPLIFMTGPFTGTKVPTSGRHQITAKSPLTGIFGECDVGGGWGVALKSCGYDGIVFTGRAARPVYLLLRGDGPGEAELLDAGDLWGLDTFETNARIRARHGSAFAVSCIGLAGEKRLAIAAIAHDGEDARMAGRCGLGAVMGAKNLKAVAAAGGRGLPVADEARFAASQRAVVSRMVEHTMGLKLYGTAGGVVGAEQMGDLPLRNWSMGGWAEAERLSGVLMRDTILRRNYYCAACPIGCGRVVEITEGPYAGVRGAGPEYETLGMLGACCLVSDLEAVTYAADLCNRAGVDTIETGAAVALAMECYEKGLLSRGDLDGVRAQWGSAEAMVALVRLACAGEGAGALLAKGVRGMAREIGGEAQSLAMHVKGLALPAHDPRCFNSLAVGYATSNRGACHLQGATYFFEKTALLPELGYAEPQDRKGVAGKGRLNYDAQNVMSVFDSLKMCKFALYGRVTLTDVIEWLSSAAGHETTLDALLRAGERIFNLKRLYNIRCGVTGKDDVLPGRILHTPRRDAGTGDNVPPLAAMLDEYYAARGWDLNGIPTDERLSALKLAR